MAFGRALLSTSSGWVVEWIGGFDFFVLSIVVALPGLPLLPWMMHNPPLATQSGVTAAAGRANGGDP